MITAIVQFPLTSGITLEQAREAYEGSAPKYRGLPGLVRKYYLFDSATGIGGGCYLWESREAAESFYDDAWRRFITDRYGAEPRDHDLRDPGDRRQHDGDGRRGRLIRPAGGCPCRIVPRASAAGNPAPRGFSANEPSSSFRRHRRRGRARRNRSGPRVGTGRRANPAPHPEHRDARPDELQPCDRGYRQGPPSPRDRRTRRRHGPRGGSLRHSFPHPEREPGPGGTGDPGPDRPPALPSGNPPRARVPAGPFAVPAVGGRSRARGRGGGLPG